MRGLKAKTPTDDNVFVEARPEAKTNAEGMDKRVRVLRDEQPTSLIVSTVEARPGVCFWPVAALLERRASFSPGWRIAGRRDQDQVVNLFVIVKHSFQQQK